MKFILDTDTIIYFLKGNGDVQARLAQTAPTALYTTIFSQSEMLYGAYKSARPQQNIGKIMDFLGAITVLPYTNTATEHYAREKARLSKSGTILADIDLFIASICIDVHGTLVTNNEKHFSRVRGLIFENWSK